MSVENNLLESGWVKKIPDFSRGWKKYPTLQQLVKKSFDFEGLWNHVFDSGWVKTLFGSQRAKKYYLTLL